MDISKLKVDVSKEREGVWVPIDDETSLLIARFGNPRHAEAMRRLSKPHKRSIDLQILSEEVAQEVMVRAVVEGVLLDWRGLRMEGQEVAYSKENAYEILMREEYREFLELIVTLSKDAQLFFQQNLETDAKKSQPTSLG